MNKYLSRVTSSARGEAFNPLIWPFFLITFSYGLGFLLFTHTAGVGQSSLFEAMIAIGGIAVPLLWGAVAVLVIVMGFTFLMFNIPPAGKVSGLLGFAVWVFAGFCWALTGGWLLVLALAIPNAWFWIWQYLSLAVFRREDARDVATMERYDAGEYDAPDGGKELRESNRGVSLDNKEDNNGKEEGRA